MWKRQKNKIIENVKIEKVWFGWIGIAHTEDGKTILVSGGVLPNMIVDVKILKKKSDFIKAQAVRIMNSEKLIVNSCGINQIKISSGFIWTIHQNSPSVNSCGKWQIKKDAELNLAWQKECHSELVSESSVSQNKWIIDSEEIEKVLEQLKDGKQNINVNNTQVCRHNFIFDTDIFKSLHTNTEQYKNIQNVWCGGCKWQILPYEEQVKLKEQVVKDSFAQADFFDEVYSWIVPSCKVFNYRNKMEFSFWKYISKEQTYSSWSLWFHKQWQFSKIVDVNSCLIAWEKINQIYLYIKNLTKKSWLPVYDQFNHSWFFRHLVIREGSNTWQILINFVIASKYLDENKKDISKWIKLQEVFMQDEYLKKNVTTFIITENNGLADVVKWQDIKTKPLWGPGYIFEKLIIDEQEINFRVSAFSFFQTNTYQAQLLFQTAKDMLPNIKWNVLDLYCWAWTIWISLLKIWVGENLVWVEIVPDAVQDAYKNAEINWLWAKTKFIADKAENINFEAENIWCVVIDPPRSWLHPKVVEFLIDLKNKYNFPLLYISCNPVTMARDLKMLNQWWYNIENLKAVDMFPHTHHIEMIWLLK